MQRDIIVEIKIYCINDSFPILYFKMSYYFGMYVVFDDTHNALDLETPET